jgi:hypothetical protein
MCRQSLVPAQLPVKEHLGQCQCSPLSGADSEGLMSYRAHAMPVTEET